MTDLHWGSRSRRQRRQLLQITPFVRRVPGWNYCCARSGNKHLASRLQEDVGRGTTGQESQTRANDDQGKLETNWKTTTTDTSKPPAPDKLQRNNWDGPRWPTPDPVRFRGVSGSALGKHTVHRGKPPHSTTLNKAENTIFFSFSFFFSGGEYRNRAMQCRRPQRHFNYE